MSFARAIQSWIATSRLRSCLATGTSERIPLDYTEDFHHMAWTPDGKVMAVAVGLRGSIWKFTPEGK